MEDAKIIMIPIAKFEEILIAYPELSIKLFRVLGEKIVDQQKRLEEQMLHNTYEQIIMLLLRLSKTNGQKVNESYKLTTHFTNKELANMIGTSRETVSRTINYLKKKTVLQQILTECTYWIPTCCIRNYFQLKMPKIPLVRIGVVFHGKNKSRT